MRFLILAACAVLLAGCCLADPAPEAPGSAGLDLQPVIAKPVNGWCVYVPVLDCYVCLGVDCGTPKPLVQQRVFGTPVARPAAPAAAPCEPVYEASPCGSCSDGSCDVPYAEAWGSGSDFRSSASDENLTPDFFDYGMPPR